MLKVVVPDKQSQDEGQGQQDKLGELGELGEQRAPADTGSSSTRAQQQIFNYYFLVLYFGSEIPWKPNSKQTRTLSGETRGGWNLLGKAHGITKSPEVKDLPRSTEGPRGAVTAPPRSPAVPCPTPEGLRAGRGLTVNPPVPSRCSKGSEQPRHRHVPPSLSASGRAVPARILPDRNTAGLSHGAEERDSGMGGRIRQVPLVTIQRWQEG